MRLNLNLDRLRTAPLRAFEDTALIVAGEFTKAITDPVYPWYQGETPRDIVDTGRLRASQQAQFEPNVALYSWAVEYSLAVHNGAKLRNGTMIPARRWTQRAFDVRPPIDVYTTLLARYV